MASYRVAVQTEEGIRLIPARRHNYHRDHSAAIRALERISKRGPGRGFCWPISAGEITTMDLEIGNIPAWVETIAL